MKNPRPGMTIEETREYNRKMSAKYRKKDPEYMKRWREAHPERNRSRYRKYRYGVSHAEFVAMFEAQGCKCGCCGTELVLDLPKHDLKLSPCVDHDHETGKARSLVCNGCNVGLGCFGDSIDRLKKAIAYLKFHGKG